MRNIKENTEGQHKDFRDKISKFQQKLPEEDTFSP